MRPTWFVLLPLASCISGLAAEVRLDPIHAVLSATIRIDNKDTSGTGFLVANPSGVQGAVEKVWVVTSAHTWEGMPGEECTLIARETNGVQLVRRELALKIRSGTTALWMRNPDLDLAVLRWQLPKGLACKPIPFERLARDQDYRSGTVRLGVGAWVFTYPIQLEANSAGLPILRRGYVSSMPGNEGVDRTFLVDFTTFGGDSGAPVMVEEGERGWVLAGVVQGMHRQTDKFKLPFQETTLHYPMGLGIVIPASNVRQTIEAALKSEK